MSISQNIKICIRIRPEMGCENSTQFREIVKAVGERTIVFDPPDVNNNGLKSIFTSQRNKDLKFAFDNVFGPEASQLDVYANTTAPVLDSVLNGYNCCVFAYGATGAGKTFTMLGNKESPGVIFRTVMMLYQKIEALSDEYKYDVSVSYIEIYNESIKDLLSPGRKVFLNEGSDGLVSLRGVSMHTPSTADQLMVMLHKGNLGRTQTSTLANAESSRSHAIFQIYLRGRPKVSGTTIKWKHSKFSLIDLAGSERGTVSTSVKQQREGANINKSLLALGNVINALADRKKNPKAFIPYRDSKLTRLLKDSLGGSCQTIMIANLSPSSMSYEDTYNTLKYANRAKNIKVQLIENVVEVTTHVKDYERLIDELKTENSELKAKLSVKRDTAEKLCQIEAFNTTHQMFDKKCREVFRERAQLKREITELEAEQQTTSILRRQKELYLGVVESCDNLSPLTLSLQSELTVLDGQQNEISVKIEGKKQDLDLNVAEANEIQMEIHEYIQLNSSKMDKLGPQLLVLLWEYHLTKVQSYFTEHCVQALQQAMLTSQRQLQHMNMISQKMFTILQNTANNKENIPQFSRDQLAGEITEICKEMTETKKRRGIMWADSSISQHPTSTLFPSPKLVQPSSPKLWFTPGKSIVGSTPKLNKLQQAYVHGTGFHTPAPPVLQSCFKEHFSGTVSETKTNLIDRFDKVKHQSVAQKTILKGVLTRSERCVVPKFNTSSGPSTEATEDDQTRTLDRRASLPPKQKALTKSGEHTLGKRKLSMIPTPDTARHHKRPINSKQNTLVSHLPRSKAKSVSPKNRKQKHKSVSPNIMRTIPRQVIPPQKPASSCVPRKSPKSELNPVSKASSYSKLRTRSKSRE